MSSFKKCWYRSAWPSGAISPDKGADGQGAVERLLDSGELVGIRIEAPNGISWRAVTYQSIEAYQRDR